MIRFEEGLRARLATNLRAHERRVLPLDGRRPAAVAIVLLDSDTERHEDLRDPEVRALDARMVGVAGGASFLFCRRPATMRRHAGQWALPGGGIDDGETPLETALRELEEELGLRLDTTSFVGCLDDYQTRSGFVITPVVLWCDTQPALTPNPGEVLAVYRIGLQALLDARPRFLPIPESDRPVLQLPIGNDHIYAPAAALLFQFTEVALRGRTGLRVDGVEEPVFAWR